MEKNANNSDENTFIFFGQWTEIYILFNVFEIRVRIIYVLSDLLFLIVHISNE